MATRPCNPLLTSRFNISKSVLTLEEETLKGLQSLREVKPRIELVCTNGKYSYADFNPGIRLGPPNPPGFWGQPQMEVMVRVDDAHGYHGWNWIRDRFLSMDKGTTRALIGAHIFKVEIRGRRGPEIAEFSPAGLDLARIKHACDLTPKRPGKD